MYSLGMCFIFNLVPTYSFLFPDSFVMYEANIASVQALIYLNKWLSRGENGELRVGVRRVARQQSSMPSSVISSQSMHLGVLATASHAVSTQTLFVVYYKPRYDNLLASN